MAFTNHEGQSISYDSSNLIKELSCDISEFGGDKLVYVVTEEIKGVIVYKDYDFENTFTLREQEQVVQVSMTALLLLYEQENSLF